MGLDNIDIDGWGKQKPEPRKKPPRLDEEKDARAPAPRARGINIATMKPSREVPLSDVPIDALRGLYYFSFSRPDKKQSKQDLKHALREFLSSNEKLEAMLQNIIDVLHSKT